MKPLPTSRFRLLPLPSQYRRLGFARALPELDCIPTGMELFPATDEDSWTLIKNLISECDYYVLVVGGRYGSIGPGGKSYTESG